MKKISGLVALVILVSMFAFLFSGCASDEISLMNAISRTASIRSMESKTNIKLSFLTWGFTGEDKVSMQQMRQMINGASLSVNQKLNQNSAKTSVKEQMDISLSAAGQKINSQIWVDSNTTGKKPVVLEIVKLPEIATAFLPPDLSSKQYAVLNSEALPGLDTIDYQKMESLSKNFAPKLVKFLQTFCTQFNPGFNSVTRKGSKTINGVNLPVFELKLNDGSFKLLIKYVVNSLLENKDTINLAKDLVKSMAEASGDKQTTAEIDQTLNELIKGKPGFLKEFNKAMDTFRMVRILSNKGIVIDFTVNKAGYIVNTSGSMDISFNTGEVEKAVNKFNGIINGQVTSKGVINIGLTFNTDISNINNDIAITMPKLNSNNSFDFSKLIDSVMVP